MRRMLLISFTSIISLCLVLLDSGRAQKGNSATGYFTDGPVQGLTYKTATQSGTTDNNGKFGYLTGAIVTFSVL
jgi:hypothetical protein